MLLCACAGTAGDLSEGYVVQPHDTLYSIAWRHDVDFRDLARWNNIGPDFRITVGEVLVLAPGRAPPSQPQAPLATRAPAPAAPQSVPASRAQGVPGGAAMAGAKWSWPTDLAGTPRPVASGGIILPGRLGQDVRAASAGRVVYTGSGLRGYGNLIIIKHGDSLLSAYAHNREMLVHDGQDVAMGQVIAHMGQDAQRSPLLYFEIRQNGKAVDPLPFLAKAK